MRFLTPRVLAILMTTAFVLAGPLQEQIYKPGEVTQAMVDKALKKAQAEKKYLMIEFGADWCVDCVALTRNLDSGETGKYFKNTFVVLKVDVGTFDQNLKIAKALGVQINAIPTAAFYAPDGTRIGATNKGELEPSAKYGTKQILAFLKEVAERRSIVSPSRF